MQASIALLILIASTLRAELFVFESANSNGNIERAPLSSSCYETEGTLFVCHGMQVIAAISSTQAAPAINITDARTAKEMAIQDARSAQLRQAGSVAMTSRVPTLEDSLAHGSGGRCSLISRV